MCVDMTALFNAQIYFTNVAPRREARAAPIVTMDIAQIVQRP